MNTTLTKKRVALSIAQMQHIISLCKKEMPITENSMVIVGVLAPIITALEQGGIRSDYTVQNKNSIAVDLGFAAPLPAVKKKSIATLYELYQLNPTSLTVEETFDVSQYMYDNNIFSTEQKRIWEIQQGAPTSATELEKLGLENTGKYFLF